MIDSVRFQKKGTTAFEIRCENCDQHHLLEACPINSFWRNRLSKTRFFRDEGPHVRENYSRGSLISIKVRLGLIGQAPNLDEVYTT